MSISTVIQGKRKATNAETKDRALATRNRVIEVLAGTANGCLSELGYYPGMPQKMQEMEQQNRQWQTENVKLFEDNRRLVEVIRSQNERLDWSRLPDANRIAKIIELQEENRFLKLQRDDLLKKAAMPGAPGAQTRQPSYEQLYAEYCKLVDVHRGAMSEINHLKQQIFAQSQQNTSAPNSRNQTPLVPSNAPSIHQPHSQMQPHSHNTPTFPSAQGQHVQAYQQHPVQLTQTQRAFYQQKPPGPSTSLDLQVSEQGIAPAQAQQNPFTATLSTKPQNQDQPMDKFQETMSIVSSWSNERAVGASDLPHNIHRAAQPESRPPTNSGTVYSPIDVDSTPSTRHQPSPQTPIVGGAIVMPYSQSELTRFQAHPLTESQSLPTSASGVVGYAEPPTISTVAQHNTVLQPQGPNPPSIPTTRSPTNTRKSSTPTVLELGSEGAPIVSPVVEGVKRSIDEVSHDALDHVEDSLKKPRLEVSTAHNETGGDSISRPVEEIEESDDDEAVEVGPDGLRVVSDCLESLLVRDAENDAVQTCGLCYARFRMGYLTEAREPFVNASEDELVLHFTSEHAEAWHALRTEV